MLKDDHSEIGVISATSIPVRDADSLTCLLDAGRMNSGTQVGQEGLPEMIQGVE
jgi:hypothetical protein